MIIYSPNNFELLNKLRKDLIEVGYVDDDDINGRTGVAWNLSKLCELATRPITNFYVADNIITLLTVEPGAGDESITLTESNYTDILNQLKDAL